ncbi:hypothetical protein Zmor_005047 [Zophobas morio]|uniref:Uncharacterized protein n=1 Tax=Zophobas morio TaxID=2755281 RepID=A0AA38MLA0_9CUCU|nr:hypothetical protein Zmor_005047 [Zophobas morio]
MSQEKDKPTTLVPYKRTNLVQTYSATNMFSLLIVLTITTTTLANDCSLLLDPKSPFIVTADFVFPSVAGLSNRLNFTQNEIFHLQCAKGTFHKDIAEEGEEVICLGYNNLVSIRTGKIFDFRDVRCKQKLTVTQRLNKTCGNNGTKLQIGFEVRRSVLPVIQVCFDEVNLTPIYIEFDKTNYNLQTTRDQLIHLLESDLYLIRTELAPDTLFYGPIERYAALDYSIIIPVWNRYCAIYTYGMIVTAQMERMKTFFSGTLGVATVPNSDKEDVELYLYDGKMPVPRWVWYLVYNDTSARVQMLYNYPELWDPMPIYDEWYATICPTDGGVFDGYTGYCFVDSLINEDLKKIVGEFWPRKK